MGNIYFGVCLDCKKAVELYKYYDWVFPEDYEWDLFYSKKEKDVWVERALILHWFLNQHNGHRFWVGHDNDPFIDHYIYKHECSFFDDYERVICSCSWKATIRQLKFISVIINFFRKIIEKE